VPTILYHLISRHQNDSFLSEGLCKKERISNAPDRIIVRMPVRRRKSPEPGFLNVPTGRRRDPTRTKAKLISKNMLLIWSYLRISLFTSHSGYTPPDAKLLIVMDSQGHPIPWQSHRRFPFPGDATYGPLHGSGMMETFQFSLRGQLSLHHILQRPSYGHHRVCQ